MAAGIAEPVMTGFSKNGDRVLLVFNPSAYGGSLLVAANDSGGQYYELSNLTILIDDSGEVLYNESKKVERDDPFVCGVVVDPLRDLVVKPAILEGSEPTIVIQEYGCLN